jgi:hypothetical protein
MATNNFSGWSTDELLQQLLTALGITPTSGYSTDILLQLLLTAVSTSGLVDSSTGITYKLVVNNGVLGIQQI